MIREIDTLLYTTDYTFSDMSEREEGGGEGINELRGRGGDRVRVGVVLNEKD